MILGAILAGGRSRRFGSDKARALLDGRALIDHVASALAPHVDRVIVCGGAHAGLPTVPDRPEPDLGPLGGINAALRYAEEHGFARVITLPCDTPVLDAGLIALLAARGDAAIVGECPVVGVWPSRLAPDLDRFLADSGDRSVRAWARAADAISLSVSPPPNINSPADLAHLADRSPTPE